MPNNNGGAFYCVAAFSSYYRSGQFTEECEFQWVQCRCKDRQVDSLLQVPGGEAVGRDVELGAAEPVGHVAELGAAEPVWRAAEQVERRGEEPERR